MKILDTYWFNGGGIVRVDTDYDGIVYYIRSINTNAFSAGTPSPEVDAEYIANYGSTFPKAAGDALFGVDLPDVLPIFLKRQAD